MKKQNMICIFCTQAFIALQANDNEITHYLIQNAAHTAQNEKQIAFVLKDTSFQPHKEYSLFYRIQNGLHYTQFYIEGFEKEERITPKNISPWGLLPCESIQLNQLRAFAK